MCGGAAASPHLTPQRVDEGETGIGLPHLRRFGTVGHFSFGGASALLRSPCCGPVRGDRQEEGLRGRACVGTPRGPPLTALQVSVDRVLQFTAILGDFSKFFLKRTIIFVCLHLLTLP